MWVVTKNLYSYKTSQPVIHHLCGVVRFFLLLSSSSPHCIIYNCLTCPMMPHAFQNSSVFLRTLKVKPILFCDVPIIRERQNGPLLIHQNSKVQTIKHGVSLQIGFVYLCPLNIWLICDATTTTISHYDLTIKCVIRTIFYRVSKRPDQ